MTSDLEYQLRRALRVERSRGAGDPSQLRRAIWDWGALGYPGIHSVRFYLTEAGRRRYLALNRIEFPPACCVCGGAGTEALAFHAIGHVGPISWRRREPVLSGIPHCGEHAGEGVQLVVQVSHRDAHYASAMLLARNLVFLKETLELNIAGEYAPPWVAFPGSQPAVGWNQGINEDWLGLAFLPFWKGLRPPERLSYLERWSSPPEWTDWLSAL